MQVIMNNLTIIMQCMIVFAFAWVGNFFVSLFYNIVSLKENFQWKKCYQGILKAIVVAIGLLFVTIAITLIPSILNDVGIPISQELTDFVSIVTIVGLFGSAAIWYAKDAIITFKNILVDGGVVFQDETEENFALSEPLDIDEFAEEFFSGTSLDTAETSIENMDYEEPQLELGQIGLTEETKETNNNEL